MDTMDYTVIRVPSKWIPEGAELVEAYQTAREVVVCGDPPAEEDDPEGERHNCDFMGCSSPSHVIYRFPIDWATEGLSVEGWYWYWRPGMSAPVVMNVLDAHVLRG